ncbi:Flp pilus assembly protein CpaB [Roseibium album]|uniref:Flp pilus assembly protein CpaB n=1 Tax=Roseibium album TaxID=311410 RepID=A0A0M6ZGY8_9HYPH|nr:Flp pilus assembly protein CpaB [Roseibium album]CTQ62045.1 Flp pilus assembly protein CpaB [Roseibium album]CTQ78403.1 Flp pilus assembly protein CpaB [Roseibium album]CTQ79810.1 Flp pilus assembly protein CpaB [Roseibium album]
MKVARILVLVVAVVAGLLAFRMVMLSGGGEPAPQIVQAPTETKTTQVLIADVDIPLGAKLTKENFDWSDWPEDALPRGAVTKANTPAAQEDFLGQIAKAPIFAGEPIRPERLINTDKGFMAAILPKGKRAIAVRVEEETTAGGFILPGDKVDLILTRRFDEGAVSETILENKRVLAIDATTAGEQDQKNLSPKKTATLELTLAESEIVAQAQQTGTISLALRSAQDSADDAEEDKSRRNDVSYVKYGITSKAIAP